MTSFSRADLPRIVALGEPRHVTDRAIWRQEVDHLLARPMERRVRLALVLLLSLDEPSRHVVAAGFRSAHCDQDQGPRLVYSSGACER